MNKILEKAKELRKEAEVKGEPKNLWEAYKGFPTYHKIGLPLGIIGTGIGVAGLVSNIKSNRANEEQQKLNEKSLAALQKIHKALVQNPPTKI